ncbi:MAG TPA: ABC transporter substrate-binding protein [Tepiditoga sp.]|nr:ABC transporter substrate-binding protein [Thermotogota bacterium]HOO74837.1 ABC transporter substrate-binding protein [Tepiditoga sp.]
MKKVVLTFITAFIFISLFASFTLIDDIGRAVTFDSPAKRVVSAAPAVSDFLNYLDAKDNVIGVTDWDTTFYDIEKIGNMTPLNIEKIISLNPDIVFISGGFQENEIENLDKFGIKTFVINPVNLNDIYESLVKVGFIIGKDNQAIEMAKKMRAEVTNIAINSFNFKSHLKAIYIMDSSNPAEIWTSGLGSFFNEVIGYAGALNLTSGLTGNNGWVAISSEYVIFENPDVIIVPTYYPGDENAKNSVVKNPIYKNVNAVKNNHIIEVDGNKASQASPSLIEVLKKLYNDLQEIK